MRRHHRGLGIVQLVGAPLGLAVLIAACSPAGPSRSVAPSPVASAPEPASSATVPASLEPISTQSPTAPVSWPDFADGSLRPALNDLSDAFNAWAQAFNVAAQTGASTADKAAYAAAAAKLRTALQDAQDALDRAPDLPCAADARAATRAYLGLLSKGLEPLLTKGEVSLGDLALAGALLQEAAGSATDVGSAIKTACQ